MLSKSKECFELSDYKLLLNQKVIIDLISPDDDLPDSFLLEIFFNTKKLIWLFDPSFYSVNLDLRKFLSYISFLNKNITNPLYTDDLNRLWVSKLAKVYSSLNAELNSTLIALIPEQLMKKQVLQLEIIAEGEGVEQVGGVSSGMIQLQRARSLISRMTFGNTKAA